MLRRILDGTPKGITGQIPGVIPIGELQEKVLVEFLKRSFQQNLGGIRIP